jgi:hypothetical protein
MSIASNKSEIISKIKVYYSLANSIDADSQNFDSLLSTTNSPVDFLFDIVKASVGENGLEVLTQVILSKIISQKKLNDLSDKLYDLIGNSLPEKGVLPPDIKQNGIKIPVKSIDPTDSFRNSNLSGGTKNTNAFFEFIKTQVLPNANAANDITFSLVGVPYNVSMNYSDVTNEIRVGLPDINLLDLYEGMRGAIGPMFNSSIVVSEIIKILFHTNFKKEDAQVLTIIRSYTNYESEDIFKLDLKKLLDIEYDGIVEGYNIDISCFRENITITEQQINDVIAQPTVQKFTDLVPELNVSTTQETLTNAKNDFFKKLINALGEALLSIILKQPVILFLINIFEKIQNLNFNFEVNINDIMQKLKALLEKIFDMIYEDFFCIIFNWVKKNILKIVIAVAIKLLREQLERREKVLLSLTGVGNIPTIAQI